MIFDHLFTQSPHSRPGSPESLFSMVQRDSEQLKYIGEEIKTISEEIESANGCEQWTWRRLKEKKIILEARRRDFEDTIRELQSITGFIKSIESREEAGKFPGFRREASLNRLWLRSSIFEQAKWKHQVNQRALQRLKLEIKELQREVELGPLIYLEQRLAKLKTKELKLTRAKEEFTGQMQKIMLQAQGSSPTTSTLQTFQLEVAGEVNGKPVKSNADSGSSYNVMSEEFALSLRLDPMPGTERSVLLPSGEQVTTLGNIDLDFKFAGESTPYILPCVVLRTCHQSLVFGSRFLKDTMTLTKYFSQRVKKVISGILTRHSVNLLGAEHEVVPGYLNGHRTIILPDTGSNAMVMSGKTARRLRLKIFTQERYISTVRFIDGSQTTTDGMVRNVKLQIRPDEKPIVCKFHVIENLPVDTILSNAMVERLDIFSTYKDLLTKLELREDEGGVYGITLVERCKEDLKDLEASYLEDMSSKTPFSQNNVDRECARRDKIRDRIALLPAHLRPSEQEKEERRKKQFDDLWRGYRERVNLIPRPPVSNPNASSGSESSLQTPESQPEPSQSGSSSNINASQQPSLVPPTMIHLDLEQGGGPTHTPGRLNRWKASARRWLS